MKLIEKSKWAKELNRRADGRVEWLCSHGVGHTILIPKGASKNMYGHGCDLCCSKEDKHIQEIIKELES